MMHDRRQRLQADLLLLTVAVIWGSAFVGQRVAAPHIGVYLFNGLRFLLGAVVVFVFLRRRVAALTRQELLGGLLAGAVLFLGAALQQAGIQYTTAGKAAFITGLYVILVPLYLAVLLRRSPAASTWAAALMATTGLFLLSVTEALRLAPGDGVVLLSALLWAVHVLVIDRLAKKVNVLRLAMVQYLVCGALSLLVGLGVDLHTLAGLQTAWWPVVYTGVLSVGVGYTLQVFGQRVAPAADTAVILSLEGVFAAVFGWLFLGELLTTRQIIGCGLMLAAMLLAQIATIRRDRKVRRVL